MAQLKKATKAGLITEDQIADILADAKARALDAEMNAENDEE